MGTYLLGSVGYVMAWARMKERISVDVKTVDEMTLGEMTKDKMTRWNDCWRLSVEDMVVDEMTINDFLLMNCCWRNDYRSNDYR